MALQSINPATEEVLAHYDEQTTAQIDDILDEAQAAFKSWRNTSFDERAALFHKAADYLRANKGRLSTLITEEMGKPIVEAEAEIEKCAWSCDFFADNASRFLADEPISTNARESFVAFEPLGVVLAIMPWNFPFWQVFRFASPSLMAGNTAVLKHADNVSGCALAIEELFECVGFPRGVFRTLLVTPPIDEIIADRRITAVTLTGSDVVGSQVAAVAGRALKKCVLELGGSDPFIVLDDADLDGAVEFAVKARYQNTGQSCIAAKRFIVVEDVADAFEQRFVETVGKLRIGDPMDRATQIGPLVHARGRDKIERQVRASVEQGARVAIGGTRLGERGYYYAPTVLTGVRPAMPVFREEVFGPVAAVIRVRNTDEAIACANDSQFGLGGNIWTRDVDRGKRLARKVESGNVFINGMTASDPRLPFGGVKRSGYGRELSVFGIREFVNIQTIWVGPAQGPAQPPPPATE